MNGVDDSIPCNDIFCRLNIHHKLIFECFANLVHICIHAGEKSLPQCYLCKKLKAYWSEIIQAYEECSLFIFPVAKCRKATRTLKKKYHYFLILCVGQPLIKNTGTGHAWLFIVGDRREFRRECKKMCGSVISKYFTIYGISGKTNVAALFSKHMKTYIIHTEIIKKISLIYIMWKMTILQQKTALIS